MAHSRRPGDVLPSPTAQAWRDCSPERIAEGGDICQVRLVEFEAPTPGKYTIQIEPSLDVIHPSVRPSAPLAELQGEVVGVLIGLAAWGLGVLAIFVGVVLLIIALVLKKPANKQVVES